MTKRPSRGGRGKDDLAETLQALSARVLEAVEKVKAAQHTEGHQAVKLLAIGRAVQEFNATKADVRRELEANLKEARQVGDLRRCVAFQRRLLAFKE